MLPRRCQGQSSPGPISCSARRLQSTAIDRCPPKQCGCWQHTNRQDAASQAKSAAPATLSHCRTPPIAAAPSAPPAVAPAVNIHFNIYVASLSVQYMCVESRSAAGSAQCSRGCRDAVCAGAGKQASGCCIILEPKGSAQIHRWNCMQAVTPGSAPRTAGCPGGSTPSAARRWPAA